MIHFTLKNSIINTSDLSEKSFRKLQMLQLILEGFIYIRIVRKELHFML